MSGMMVDRRDQVRITVFLPDSLRTSTFLSRWSSTNGPFFRLRGIGYLPAQRFLPVRRRRTISLSDGLLWRGGAPGLAPGGGGGGPPGGVAPPPPRGGGGGGLGPPPAGGGGPLPPPPP